MKIIITRKIVDDPHQTKQAGPDEQRRVIATQALDADSDARVLREMDGQCGFDAIVRPLPSAVNDHPFAAILRNAKRLREVS